MSSTGATDVVCDASVVLKWFRGEDEDDVAGARALLDAHTTTRKVLLYVLDLTLYEVGNPLVRKHHMAASDIASVLAAIRTLCRVIVPTSGELEAAVALAGDHGLTLYDSAYAATALARGAVLVTVDSELLEAGLGERPSALVTRLGLGD